MLLKKIHHLKNNIVDKVSNVIESEILESLDKDKKIEYLEKKLNYFEEQVKTQNALNNMILNRLETQEKEKTKLEKDMQIIIAAVKDIYLFIESDLGDSDFITNMLLKKNKKNDTYH